ncbi:MAG: protein kinase [Myxococcales bacterium]|nr:protein kinase [Myxococcales bacterium]
MSVIGLRVGPFEIVESATVPEPGSWFRATRAGMTQRKPTHVLVKLLPPHAGEAERADLQRELDRLRAVEDPRVPGVVALYEGIGALALDAPDGISCQEIIEAREEGTVAMTPATLLDIGLEVAETLQHAHHRNRFHGHLAASHVRVSLSGKLHVFGFGPGPETPAEPDWCPPERARGQPGGPATDQWSLAAILAGLITGHPPWHGGRDPRTGDMEPALEAIERQWPALARLFRRMLEPDPANRFPTMHPVRQELLALARKAGASSDRRELGKRMARRIHRHVVPDTGITAVPEASPQPPPEPASEPTGEPDVSRDPIDPPSLPDAERADAPPAAAPAPLADEPLDVVSPEHDASNLTEARRPLELTPTGPSKDADEEDIDDDPTVRFDPMAVRDLADLDDDEPPSPRPKAVLPQVTPTPRGRRETISDEIVDDPQTLARALAVAPDAAANGGMPTAVPITDVDDFDDLDAGSPLAAPIDGPGRGSFPPRVQEVEELEELDVEPVPSGGPDVKRLAPILVGVMVLLMVVVVIASLL